MLKNTSWITTLIVIASAMLSGCATTANFNQTPTDASEFKKNFVELKQAYPDIDRYDRYFAGPNSCPQESALEKKWGEPITRKRWGMYAFDIVVDVAAAATGYVPAAAALFLLKPTPGDEYVWKKGGYQITAKGRNDLLVGYDKRIFSWEWKRTPHADAIAYGAKHGQ